MHPFRWHDGFRARAKMVTEEESGTLGRIRTRDPLVRSQVLYPLSYERESRSFRRMPESVGPV